MRKLPFFILFTIVISMLTSCLGDDTWGEYSDWRNANLKWLSTQANLKNADGSKYYELETSSWDTTGQVLIHWFNDTNLTKNNLKPLYSSTVDVKYRGRLYNDTVFDSSYTRTTPADSLFRCTLNSGVILGWGLALTRMHIGDSCRVVIPYSMGYGSQSSGKIKPYSALLFDIKLVAIPFYETKKKS